MILPSLFNYIVANYKRNKTIKKIKASLNEKGYIVDKRMEKDIVRKIIVDYKKDKYEDKAWHIYKALSFAPIIRWIILPVNIKFLCGDSSLNETYWYYEDIIDHDENVIDFLEECGYIHVDKEKKKWINDRDNALKNLEKKYDDNSENNKENVMEVYENDNLEMLKLKRKWLDEMIELKTKSQKENDNIQAEEIKKENSNVELDNLSLKYTPDKKKKN